MFQKLVSHNDDIRRLVEKGYAVAFDSSHLVVRDIPYLNANLELEIGSIVDKLNLTNNSHAQPHNHQIFFAGSQPHGLDGKPITGLGESTARITLSDASNDVIVERAYSNKRKINGAMVPYDDFFQKIEHYVSIISGPAMEKFCASPLTFRTVEETEDSVFNFHDTMTSRAEITDLSNKFKDEVVALIGLGGTGAYLLDFLVKTPVKEIRGYDNDDYYVHNAYRSPGRLKESELKKKKSNVYQLRYNNFHKGLYLKDARIGSKSTKELDGVTFAFVCVDKGSSRKEIIDILISLKIPFIDVGIGLRRKKELLSGMARTTYFSVDNAGNILAMNIAETQNDDDENEYKVNIQIAEMNALNAALAMIRYKQIRGFYFSEEQIYHCLFDIQDMKIVAESEVV